MDDLAMQIADWVNSQLRGQEARLAKMGFEERIKAQTSKKLMLESGAMREILPTDEVTDKEIGPSGGCEDSRR